ncbi:MAG: tetratricopeptide repeat protein [Nitrosomonas sp.]|nr:tetratricopeptide repeat protein [Nitrosomonas sp.]
MARVDFEEQEKLDTLKTWWNRYGTIITIMLAVAVATIGGTKVWEYFQRQQAQQAADLYALLKQVQTTGDLMKITDAAHLLTEGYASSGYAPRAALIVAKASVDAGDLQRAKTHLQWVMENAKEPEMIDLARLRLATVLLDEKNYAAALQQLNTRHSSAFSGLYADLKGDVLLASGKIDEARLAYEAAVNALSKNTNYHNIVQMKADALSEPYTAERLLKYGADSQSNVTGKTDTDARRSANDAGESADAVEALESAGIDEADESAVSADSDAASATEEAAAGDEAGESDASSLHIEESEQTEETTAPVDMNGSGEKHSDDESSESDK